MAIPIRYVLMVVFIVAGLCAVFEINNDFSSIEALASLRSSTISSVLPNGEVDDASPSVPGNATTGAAPHTATVDGSSASDPVHGGRANATFVILCRNSDLDGIILSVRSIEDRFNHKYGYPYVFLNEEPFDDEFIRRVSVLSSAEMEFGVIPHDHWYAPSWIDEPKAADARKKMEEDQVIYGGSLSYRNMCRFNSGFFFRHPLLQKYRYYWRIEPSVRFHCDIPSDPLWFMESNNKSYGFTISMYEFQSTIPSLWETVRGYARAHPWTVHPDNALGFISDDGGTTYNLCHFWSNFEIGDMDFWRGETYTSFFDHLDQAGGFYYERWGDAPVHSIAAAIFLPRSSIHFFDEIGYEHPPFTHCPVNGERWANGRCSCNPERSFDYESYSCLRRWESIQ